MRFFSTFLKRLFYFSVYSFHFVKIFVFRVYFPSFLLKRNKNRLCSRLLNLRLHIFLHKLKTPSSSYKKRKKSEKKTEGKKEKEKLLQGPLQWCLAMSQFAIHKKTAKDGIVFHFHCLPGSISVRWLHEETPLTSAIFFGYGCYFKIRWETRISIR